MYENISAFVWKKIHTSQHPLYVLQSKCKLGDYYEREKKSVWPDFSIFLKRKV